MTGFHDSATVIAKADQLWICPDQKPTSSNQFIDADDSGRVQLPQAALKFSVHKETQMSDDTIIENEEQEFEEICSDEVDRVVEVLDGLIEKIQSENIKHYLEEASSNIYYLVYEDEEEEGVLDQAA